VTRRRAGAALLMVAALAAIVRSVLVWSTEWTPLEIALTDERGTVGRREFQVDRSGTYELALRIDRPRDALRRTAAECALGFDWVECAGTDPVRVRWTLGTTDGGTVRCGTQPMRAVDLDVRTSGGSFTNERVERWLGCFDANDESGYGLEAELLSGFDRLAALRPHFVVVPSSSLVRDESSLTAAVWMMSLLMGLAGVLLIVSCPPRDSTTAHAHDVTPPVDRSPVA
jgi:hypothetical protein